MLFKGSLANAFIGTTRASHQASEKDLICPQSAPYFVTGHLKKPQKPQKPNQLKINKKVLIYFIFSIFISCIDCQNPNCLDLSHELLFLVYFASLVSLKSKILDTERAAQSPQHAKC